MPHSSDMGKGDSVEVAIARIEERQISNVDKLDQLLLSIHGIESRVTELENLRWKIAGIATAIGVISAIVGRFTVDLIK